MGAAMRYQPQGRVQINWANPITRGLVFAYTVGMAGGAGFGSNGNNSPGYYSTAGGQQGFPVNTPIGVGVRVPSSSTYGIRTDPYPSSPGAAYSLFALGTGMPSSSNVQCALDDDDGTTRRFQFRVNGANSRVEFIPFNSAGNQSLVSAAALTTAEAARGFTMGATVRSDRYAVFQNGQVVSAAPSGSILAPNNSIVVGARKTNSSATTWANGGLSLVAMWSRTLSDDEMRSLAANPWQLFDAGSSSSAYQAAIATTGAATGGTTTNVSPGGGTLAIAGYAPAVAQSANQSVAPSAGSLGLTGYAPSVVQSAGQNVLPGNGSIALTGYAPQVQQSANRAVSPGAAALAVVGYAPSISQSIVTTVAPQPGALTLTGFAPTVARTANASISPSVGALTITGYAPGVARTANQTVQAGAGGLTLTGYAPAVSQARVSAYPQLYLATILSQSTLYAVSPLVDALDVDAGQSALQASLAIATIMAESRIYATASLSDAATNQTASFV